MAGLFRGVARTAVIAGTASAVSGRVQHKQQQKWANQEAEQQAQQQPNPTTSAVDNNDPTAELQQLAQLKNQGILTEEESTAKKKQILGI